MTGKSEVAAAALKYLTDADPEIAELMAKDMTAGDVHVSTALGNVSDPTDNGEAKEIAALVGAKAEGATPDKEVGKADMVLKITKVDAEERKVFGWAFISQRGDYLIVDKQNDMILPEDLEKAAHDYALHWRSQGDMHEMLDNMPVQKGRLIESLSFTKEKLEKAGLSAIDPETGEQLFGWFVAFKVDDDKLWEAHKRGERPEFSIGGQSRRVNIDV